MPIMTFAVRRSRASSIVLGLVLFAAGSSATVWAAKGQQGDDRLTNDTIVRLIKAGVPVSTIVTLTTIGPTRFEISPSAIAALHKDNVPDVVIEAMVSASTRTNDRTASSVPQVSIVAAGAAARSIPPARFHRAVSYGLFSAGIKVVIPGKHSDIETSDLRPVFEVRMPQGVSPDQFVLSRLESSDEGGARQMNLESAERFDANSVAPQLYRLVPRKDLKRGSYCLHWGDASDNSGTLMVFDFDIVPTGRK